MPGKDGTGPKGQGPMTGGRRGCCGGGNPNAGRGQGKGRGQGGRRGQCGGGTPGSGQGPGQGRGNCRSSDPDASQDPADPDQDVATLRAESKRLKEKLAEIEARIATLFEQG
jgi:hypothetical protein